MRPRTPRGELEGDGCPRRGLEEGQANSLALERIPETSLRKRPCQVEDLPDVFAANVFEERVHRGACGPSRVQNVVDEDDGLACYVERHAAAPHFGILFFEVVAMERYIQRADGDPEALKLADVRRDPPRQRDSAGKHPY